MITPEQINNYTVFKSQIKDHALDGHLFKMCDGHKSMMPPEGGVHMGSKWYCHVCWIKRNQRFKFK